MQTVDGYAIYSRDKCEKRAFVFVGTETNMRPNMEGCCANELGLNLLLLDEPQRVLATRPNIR